MSFDGNLPQILNNERSTVSEDTLSSGYYEFG